MSLLNDSTEHWRFSWKTLIGTVGLILSLAGFYYAIKYDGRATREKFDDYITQQRERDKDSKERINQLTSDLARANDGITSIRQFNALSEVRFRTLEEGQKDLKVQLDVNSMQDQLMREKVIKIEYRMGERNLVPHSTQ